jgi:hypothetical protein
MRSRILKVATLDLLRSTSSVVSAFNTLELVA